VFSGELREKAEQLVGRYPVSRSALLPLLHLVQAQDGYLSDDGIAECAQLLGLTKAEVMAVATFYTMYKREPMGRHLISVCTNFSCKVRGAQDVFEHLVDKLGVGHNGTTGDGTFTLEHAECLGNCEGAPVVSVDYYNYECMTPSGAANLLDQVASGEVPLPTRGLRSPGIRMVSHRLAGLGPHPDDEDRGHELGFATGTDGGVPPPVARQVGPQADVGVVTSEPADEPERREAADREVRTAGQDPAEVQEEAGPDAREFPTREPGTGSEGERSAGGTAEPGGDRGTAEDGGRG
jgi:NADH-quinone oxidoreductase subunit E